MSDLLSVVDELTKPSIEHVAQKTDKGEWIRTHTVEHPGLFDQLRDAGSGRTHGGSGAAKHERAPLDLDALYMYAMYSAQVADWCRLRDVQYTRNPTVDLRAFYAATLADNTFDPHATTVILSRWVTAIKDHFDPPKKFEAIYPCPICGQSAFGNVIDGGGRAIEIRYRVDDDGRVSDERALCRACETVWMGGGSVRELAEEQHEKAG